MSLEDEASKSWTEYRRLVIGELDRLTKALEALNAKMDSVRTDVTMLNVKSGLLGALAGAIGGALATATIAALFRLGH